MLKQGQLQANWESWLPYTQVGGWVGAGLPIPLWTSVAFPMPEACHGGNIASKTDKGIIHTELPASILLSGQTVS